MALLSSRLYVPDPGGHPAFQRSTTRQKGPTKNICLPDWPDSTLTQTGTHEIVDEPYIPSVNKMARGSGFMHAPGVGAHEASHFTEVSQTQDSSLIGFVAFVRQGLYGHHDLQAGGMISQTGARAQDFPTGYSCCAEQHQSLPSGMNTFEATPLVLFDNVKTKIPDTLGISTWLQLLAMMVMMLSSPQLSPVLLVRESVKETLFRPMTPPDFVPRSLMASTANSDTNMHSCTFTKFCCLLEDPG